MIDIESEKERIMGNLDSIEENIRKTKGKLVAYNFKHEIIEEVIQLQRDVEYIYSQIDYLKTPKTEKIMKRMEESVENLGSFINSDKAVSYYDGFWTSGLLGKIKSLREHEFINDSETESCLYVLNNIRHIALMNFFADTKLLNRIVSLAIEDKIKIREKLQDLGFGKTLDALDEAEDNLISKSAKDAADRCREALEKAVETVVEKIGEKVAGSFHGNTKILKEKGIIDLPTETYLNGYKNYLAQLGQHNMGKKENLEISLNYLLEETYKKIIILIEISEKPLEKAIKEARKPVYKASI